LMPNIFSPFWGKTAGRKSHQKGAKLFSRALWIVKVNFLVKNLGTVVPTIWQQIGAKNLRTKNCAQLPINEK
jgi:hypothetical protein